MACTVGSTSALPMMSGAMPKKTPQDASTAGPSHIAMGASCGCFGSAGRAPRKGRMTTTMATATISALAATAAAVMNTGASLMASAPSYFSSLPTKPRKGGKPAMEKAAASVAAKVMGSAPRRPPRRSTSRVPASWSMMPTTMNKAAL